MADDDVVDSCDWTYDYLKKMIGPRMFAATAIVVADY